MQVEHARSRRYSFAAIIDVLDVKSETQVQGRTADLSLAGCFVETPKPLPPETKVRIRIFSRGASFTALAKVIHVRQEAGMGIMFTEIGPIDQQVLEEWISQARSG